MTSTFSIGKLPAELLAELLDRHPPRDPRVVVGPGVGLDFAAIDMGDRYLVAKTDPITFATDQIGWYAVQINANDIACSGGTARWFLATILLPEAQADASMAEGIFEQIAAACDSLGISFVGGHTEITYGIDRPIVVGCLLGEVAKGQLITAAGARPSDAVMLTGGIPIEATAIIAREKETELKGRFEPAFIRRSQDYLFDPGISVVKAAALAARTGEVHAMHDPTEGGLATGLWELAEASNCGLEVVREAIPILPEGHALCEAFGLDPLASIASGSLLLTAPRSAVETLRVAFSDNGIACSAIGSVVRAESPVVRMQTSEGTIQLPRPARDEITKLFE